MALALDLQVEREHQRGALRRFRALDERGGEAAVAHHVELEPERLRHAAGHILDRADRHGGERVGHAVALGGARGEDLAVGPVEAGEADRREGHGHAHLAPEHGGAQRAPVDVDADALAQRERLQVGAVRAQRRFAVGAAIDVIENRPRHPLLRQLAQIVDAGHDRHGGRFYTL